MATNSFFPANVPLVNYFFYNYTLTANGPNLPLAGGFIFFREDDDHLVPKNTYSDVSDPNNPVVNPNPLPLNAVGAWPLFYAEEGLYYIVITGPDADFDNPIWTLEHVDFAGGAGAAGSNVINYLPNGQFLLHNDLPASIDPAYEAGQIRAPITHVAYGNWTFERPDTSTATDFVTFPEYTAWAANPAGNPKFAGRIQCTVPDSGDAYKDLRVNFPDVNRFASANQLYTFAFNGKDNLASSAAVDLVLIKNFGTGGSATTETILTTFSLGATADSFYFAFNFGTNSGKTIGADGDDFVSLAIRFRTDDEIDVQLTDFAMQAGDLANPPYQETTQQQDVSAALGGGFPVPNPNGSDLYLTPRLTANGWVYDNAEVGEIVNESNVSDYVNSLHPTSNKMLADGSQYETASYSPLGIPFARLQMKYWDSIQGMPIYGTGLSYFIAVLVATTNQFILANNSGGIVTATADGASATGFTFTNTYTAINPASVYFCSCVQNGPLELYIINSSAGDVGNGNSGTAPVTVEISRFGGAFVTQVTSVLMTGNVAPGQYFEFQTSNAGVQSWYVWFKVGGVGSDPGIGGRTGILVDVNSGDSQGTVLLKIIAAINNWQTTAINTLAASSIAGGDYFTANAITAAGAEVPYYIWYKKDGVGTDPAIAGKKGIEVDVLSADTDVQVAQKTQIAINQKYFSSPNYQNTFFRGTGGETRYPDVFGMSPQQVGSLQFDNNQEHFHLINNTTSSSQAGGGALINTLVGGTTQTQAAGGSESRPSNISVNRAIRY